MWHATYFIFLKLLQNSLCSKEFQTVKEHSVNTSNYNDSYSFSLRCQETWKENNVSVSFVAVYEGAVARTFCRYSKEVSWMYAKSLNSTFTPVLQKDRVVIQNAYIFIYRTAAEDAGAYRCQNGDNHSGLVFLEVVDDEYSLVTNSSQSSSTTIQYLGQELTVYTAWSQWSECSACGEAGRRRRFGMCYIKFNTTQFSAIPEGIPCRSRHLPEQVHNLPAVRDKRNDIMIATCKINCTQKIFELRSATGAILETADNTAGIYSLAQQLPPQPPPTAWDVLYAGRGQRVLVKCPGTTLRDIPVTWRAGTLLIDPEILRESSGGRVSEDARDRIVIKYVLNEDANLYSCWEGEDLSGTVKLAVWAGRDARWNHHTLLAIMVVTGAVLLNIAMRMLYK